MIPNLRTIKLYSLMELSLIFKFSLLWHFCFDLPKSHLKAIRIHIPNKFLPFCWVPSEAHIMMTHSLNRPRLAFSQTYFFFFFDSYARNTISCAELSLPLNHPNQWIRCLHMDWGNWVLYGQRVNAFRNWMYFIPFECELWWRTDQHMGKWNKVSAQRPPLC